MKKLFLIVLVLFCASVVEAQVTSQNARRVFSGTGVPTMNCTPGPIWRSVYIRTTDNSEYQCTSLNTWTKVTSGTPATAFTGGAVTTPITGANGTAAAPTYSFTGDPDNGMFLSAANSLGFAVAGVDQLTLSANVTELHNGATAQAFRIYNTYTDASNNAGVRLTHSAGTAFLETFKTGSGTAEDLTIGTASAANDLFFRTNGTNRWRIGGSDGNIYPVADNTYDIGFNATSTRPRSGFFGTSITSPVYRTTTNCADSAGAAACAAASAGAVVIDASATSVVVSTTAVTATSRIFVQEDSSLATELGITCNTTISRTYAVTARTAATSFTITASAAPITTPACLSFHILN